MNKLFIALLISISTAFPLHAQLAIGDIAPDIKLPDTAGKWKPLSSVQSPLILLDFWAAWCYPCILGLPDLKRLHQQYANKGLAIYAVSLDKGYYHWLNACRKHELPFVLVNDPYGFEGNACKNYRITSIPNKMLIKDGKIIAADMSLYGLEQVIRKELNIKD